MSGNNPVVGGAVVVGVDGSEASKDALRWTVRYARRTGATVQAVAAWSFPATYGWGLAPAIAEADLEGDAREALKETLEDVIATEGPVTVQARVLQGPPALVLEQAAADADLLVVGNRGFGGFAGMVLGSVSEHCIHHATCPVVVVHHSRDHH